MALLHLVSCLYLTNGCICLIVYIYGVVCLKSEPIFDVYMTAVGLLATAFLITAILLLILVKHLDSDDGGGDNTNKQTVKHYAAEEKIQLPTKKYNLAELTKTKNSVHESSEGLGQEGINLSNGSHDVPTYSHIGNGRFFSATLRSELLTDTRLLIFGTMLINFIYGLQSLFNYTPRYILVRLLFSYSEFVLFFTYPFFLNVLQILTAATVIGAEVNHLYQRHSENRRSEDKKRVGDDEPQNGSQNTLVVM